MYCNPATVAVSRSVMFEKQDMYSYLATVTVSWSVMLEQTRHV